MSPDACFANMLFTMVTESAAAAAWSTFITVAAVAAPAAPLLLLLLLLLLLRLGAWALAVTLARRERLCSSLHATRDGFLRDALEGWRDVALQRERRLPRRKPLDKRTAPRQESDQQTVQTPPQRSHGSSRGVLPGTGSDVPRQTSRSLDTRNVFRRRTPESLPRSADLNEVQGAHGMFRSLPAFNTAVADETHRRLMSEVEAGTASIAARYYADMVRRNEVHARRTGGICPSPPRCPGTP